MNQKLLFDDVSIQCSRNITRQYSTSFSLGVKALDKSIQDPIHAIYGFVRFADEIVDTFHDFPKQELLNDFKAQTFDAIEKGISLNPVLNSFQFAVRKYNIDHAHIHTFLRSMEMDLEQSEYDRQGYEQYILGSAEVVGLMCLHVFVNGDDEKYDELKEAAMRLGAAFQKINFLRDLNADYLDLGRTYFPGVEMKQFDDQTKKRLENEIDRDFAVGLDGIRRLPKTSQQGVYLAYSYFYKLHQKIKRVPSQRILEERIRIPNGEKFIMLATSILRNTFNWI